VVVVVVVTLILILPLLLLPPLVAPGSVTGVGVREGLMGVTEADV
jgi:hypothetical protein